MKKVALVCGGRDYSNGHRVNEVLDHIAPDLVIHGAARGADSLAGVWAHLRGVACIPFPADWQGYGKRAGVIRNEHMADALEVLRREGHETVVVAFPGSRGTAHMVTTAFARKFRVITCTDVECVN